MNSTATVLFVDDEERIVKLLKLMFQDKYRVLTATSGQQALEIIASNGHVDVVVSDQRMPQMTGIELLAEVRKASPDAIRVLLTGYSDLVSIIGAVNDGEVYRFLNKPWRKEDLTNTLAECVELSRKRRSPPQTSDPSASSLAQPEAVPARGASISGAEPLASAAKLLALDSMATDRHDLMEMFTDDYDVLGASSITEALQIVEHHNIGVVVANTFVNGERTADLLTALKMHAPSIVIVVLTDVADSDMVISMINHAQIYRIAIKPIQPNVFRLAVSAAMREHHRLCARPVETDQQPGSDAGLGVDMTQRIIKSLERFTDVRDQKPL